MNRKRATWLILAILMVGTVAFVVGMGVPAEAGSFNCKIVSCPAPDCLEGEHLETPPDQCCPVCVPD